MFARDRLIRKALRERFVATLRGGATFDGILTDADRNTFRFVDAYALDPKRNRVPVDGDLYLPRLEVTYLQRPGGTAT
ncbi:MAG: hypothetical protein ABI067_17650 [Leifsonia sp.]